MEQQPSEVVIYAVVYQSLVRENGANGDESGDGGIVNGVFMHEESALKIAIRKNLALWNQVLHVKRAIKMKRWSSKERYVWYELSGEARGMIGDALKTGELSVDAYNEIEPGMSLHELRKLQDYLVLSGTYERFMRYDLFKNVCYWDVQKTTLHTASCI